MGEVVYYCTSSEVWISPGESAVGILLRLLSVTVAWVGLILFDECTCLLTSGVIEERVLGCTSSGWMKPYGRNKIAHTRTCTAITITRQNQ